MTATPLKTTIDAPSLRQRRRAQTPGQRAGRITRRTLTNLLIVVILVVELYPLFWILASSFKSQNQFETQPLWSLPSTLNFQNYVDAWNTAQLGTDAINSLTVTVVGLVITLILGCGAAFALEVMVWKGRGKVLLFIVGGLMVPIQLILLPLFTIYFKLGLTNSLWPLIITYVGQGLPLTVFLMATYFRSVPRELFEACTLDGGSIYRCFISVGLPLVRNGIFTMALLLFFSIWNDLLIALTFNASPELSTVQVGLLNFNGQYGQTTYGPLFAAISIVIFATLLVYSLINQQVMKGLTAGSVKG